MPSHAVALCPANVLCPEGALCSEGLLDTERQASRPECTSGATKGHCAWGATLQQLRQATGWRQNAHLSASSSFATARTMPPTAARSACARRATASCAGLKAS